MQRSSIFITVLLSLFMFQSLWNVAAAYCGHENINTTNSSVVTHFGHHVPESSIASTHYSVVSDQEASDLPMSLNLQDHHDHLPSCFHVVVIEAQQQLLQPIPQIQQLQPQYHWFNSYQSPDLTGHHPPPVLTPL